MVAAGAAVEVAAGEPLQTHLVGDAALAVRHVWAQRERASQGAALQAASLDGALLRGGPGDKQAGKLKRWPGLMATHSPIQLSTRHEKRWLEMWIL